MVRQTVRGGFGLRPFLVAGLLSILMMPGSAVIAPVLASAQTQSADALFSRATADLAARTAFAADFEIITSYATDYLDTRETGTVSFARPDRLRVEIARFRRIREGSPWEETGNGSIAVSDGKQAWNVTTHPKSSQFESQPVSEKWLASTLAPLTPLGSLLGQNADDHVADAPPVKQIVAGETFDVVTNNHDGESRSYYFDNEGLLRRVVIDRQPAATKNGGRESFRHREVRLSRFTALSPTEVSTRFVYSPPADAVKVTRAARSGRSSASLQVGDAAPEIVAEDVDGKPVKLSDYAGKPVLVKFWATWCWPCRQSLPETEEIAKQNAGRATVLAVALWDSRKAFHDFVTKYAAERHTTPDKLPIRFVFDPRPMGQDAGSALYGIRATPTHVLVGADGKVRAIESGYTGRSQMLEASFAALR